MVKPDRIGGDNRDVHDRAPGLLRNGVTAVLALAFLAGIFLPVYADEVGWRFQERAGIDGVDKLFSDICGPNTLAVPPLFMMPVRYFSAYMNLAFADPFYVRISGILYALLWLAMLLALFRRIAVERRDQAVLGLLGIGLMGLANMPLLLVWSRPEQPILLTLTASLILAFQRERGEAEASAGTAWLRSLVILFLATIAVSYHLKALVLVPAYLACLWLASPGRAARLPRLLASGALVAVAGFGAHYWLHRLQCPADPELQKMFARQNIGAYLSAVDGFSALLVLIGKMLRNIDLWQYLALSLPSNKPMSDWLPAGQVSPTARFVWGAFVFSCWGIAAIFAALGLVHGVKRCLHRRSPDPRVILALLLLAAAAGWCATQVTRNVYEATFVVPLLMLAFVFAIAAKPADEGGGGLRDRVAMALGVAAMVSIVLTGLQWRPALTRSNAQSGYIAEQPYSVSVFGYGRLEPQIFGAARKCGIGTPEAARALLIDDLTYFPFMASKLPQNRLGVFGIWRGTIRDPVAYLKSRGSGGMIVGCHIMPKRLRDRARREGAFCCLGPPDW